MAPRKLQVGVAGLGRMGKRHAMNFFQAVPRASLVAVSSPDAVERAWAQETLGSSGVKVYESFEDMLGQDGLDAVCIASATAVHAAQAIAAIDAGKHVLCEKPLATTPEKSESVIIAAARRPELKVMCGFSRRFDASYCDAREKVAAGMIGRPSVFRSQTCDMFDPTGFFVQYAALSGGIFVDCGIHDVDLALWFFSENGKKEPRVKSVYATGITAIEPGLQEHKDADNAVGVIEFDQDRIAYIYCSRMMAAGQEDSTEIIGTKGKLSVNLLPQDNLVRIYEAGGIRHELPQNYWGRFQNAFAKEAVEWTNCCLDGIEVPVKLSGAVMAVRIAAALQESMVTRRKVWFDGDGVQTDRAQL
ncbi:putative NAD binding Rossmann fold oxidoreductase [Thozetella sp. PMI_491]|nr:putative NAD binding Rossmann fold oxidoreductase [Thozetella sp. PMI_491]